MGKFPNLNVRNRSETMSEPATLPVRRVLQMDGETLAFFLVLYRTESLPKAAAEMNISLSSANRQLARLREAWADPLFVRSGLLMKATPAAARRYDRVQRVVREIEALTFDEEVQPALLKQIVRIATYDNAFTVGLAAVFGELQGKLPGVQFRAVQADEHMFEDLRADRLDMAFYARQGVQPGIHSTPLFTTPYACVTRKGHPLEKVVERHGHLDREDLARFRTVLVNAQPDRNREPNSPANGWFNPPSADKVAMVLPFFLAAPLALPGTDCYAVIPAASARLAFETEKFSILPFGPDAPELTVRLGWHERTHADPACQLIRSVLIEAVRKKAAALL